MKFEISRDWPKTNDTTPIKDLLANHSLIVGQSRSGKTTVARRLVEEIILRTAARVIIIDPNSDFIKIDKIAKGSSIDFVNEWKEKMRQCEVISKRIDKPPGLSWGRLLPSEKQAVLRLSPEENFLEYREFRRHLEYEKVHGESMTFEAFRESKFFQFASGESVERYRAWLEGVTAPGLWVPTDLDNIIEDENKRLIVIDLAVEEEQVRYMTAARTLEVLWRAGEKKRTKAASGRRSSSWVGTIVVIDEAHLFAPPVAEDPQRRLLAERVERFCDQGKKLNLFLVLITQQPSKLNPRILSECNNRIILRMNDQLSLKVLENAYGGERGRYDGSLTFPPNQGWGLIEGALLSDMMPPDSYPRFVRFMKGRTQEGGGSPSTKWIYG